MPPLPSPAAPSSSQDNTLSQNEVYGRFTKPIFGEDLLFACDPKKRNQQMQHMAYGLRTANLKSYVPMIEKETREYLESWGESVRTRATREKKKREPRVDASAALCLSAFLHVDALHHFGTDGALLLVVCAPLVNFRSSTGTKLNDAYPPPSFADCEHLLNDRARRT